jgi:O-methyltransferase involved in polyketide biosynthesis
VGFDMEGGHATVMSQSEGLAKVPSDLSGVPETLLGNLNYRAVAARSRHPVLEDPKAIELVERIDYPFEQFVGDRTGQRHALRVRKFDEEIRRFLAEHPGGTVVALGEGLETQFWRVDNGRVQWLTVDLPEPVNLRRQLLPDGPRRRTLACSATDSQWMDHVDSSQGVMITAQGLLMYLQPGEVDRLVDLCAQRFPGQSFLFDAVPAWIVARQGRSDEHQHGAYQMAAWVWGVDAAERRRLGALPGVATFAELRSTRGKGFFFGLVLPALRRVPKLRDYLPEFPVFRVQLAVNPASATHP